MVRVAQQAKESPSSAVMRYTTCLQHTNANTAALMSLAQCPAYSDLLKCKFKHAAFVQEFAKRARPNSGTTGKRSKSRSGKSRTPTTLKDLVDHGVIIPGRNKISVAYKGTSYVANLGKDAAIVYQGRSCRPRMLPQLTSPAAFYCFSIAPPVCCLLPVLFSSPRRACC